jgi:hypothetical protein
MVATLFLQEIPLKQSKKRKPASEAGDELAVGLGQAEGKDEPVIIPRGQTE